MKMSRTGKWVGMLVLVAGAMGAFLLLTGDRAESRRAPEGAQRSPAASEAGSGPGQTAPARDERLSDAGDRLPPANDVSRGDSAVETADPATGIRAARAGTGAPPPTSPTAGHTPDDRRGQARTRSAADILAEANMQDPVVRERVVAQLRAQSETRRAEAWARADALDIPVRIETPAGNVIELQAFDGDRPLYYTTHNRDAAISAAVPALYAPPYAVNGEQTPVGVWDAGSVRSTHQELSGRVNLMNSGAALDDHATHVAGTIAAAGVQAQAQGMAPAAAIYSLDWNNDLAEMAMAGAATADDTDLLPISNHSYGLITGYMPVSATRWRWFGQGQAADDVDPNFGRYHESARDWDALAHSLPYYSIFTAAGNDRTDNPAAGHRVDNFLGLFMFNYDPAVHPKGDGVYRGGYETISYSALAKNVITVGAVDDAVSGGLRSVAHAGMSTFSSWGPTDDGRIKPDLVANGVGLYSSVAQGDAAYSTYSGTSMATPSAVGAATLLIELYRREFSNRLMPASLLKALLAHTADELGTPGPDYRYGWGLINVERAAALMADHLQNAGSPRLITSAITVAEPSFSHTFEWDGTEPIRVTLSWTDPAGEQQTAHDSRTPVLVHDLDLSIVGPNGDRYLPYVMPFVGTWTIPSLSLPAETGTNRVDNTEQVFIADPAIPGAYTIDVTLSGDLTRSTQPFSLVVSGAAEATGETRVLDLQGDLQFGSLAVGTLATRSMTIRNIGNAPLEVTGLETPDGFTAAWSGIVHPDASQDVTVQFSPTEAKSYDGVIRVLSDASAGADTVPVSGRGVQQVLPLENGVPVPDLAGTQGNEQYFVLAVPTGQARLDIDISGGNGGDADLYVRHGQLPTTSQWDYRPYLVGSEETVEVENPAAGDWYIMVRAYTAYTDVTLTGTYVPPVTPTRILRLAGTLAYGNIPVGDRVIRTVTLHNEGSETLTVSGIHLPTGFDGDWAGSIPSGGSQAVDIAFEPLLEQAYSGQLTVSSDKTSGDEALPVSGNGVINHIPLQNGVEVGPFNGVAGSTSFFYIDVPAGQDSLEVRVDGGEGEPDLYVRRGAAPSLDAYDYLASEDDPRVLLIDDPASDRWYIMLHGVVQYTEVRLVARYATASGASRVIRLEPPLDFGVLRVNETAVRAFDIHNDGTGPLNVSGITYPDGFSGQASVSIPPGESHRVQVTFSPATPGQYGGVLTVQSDATAGDASLPVTGQAVDMDTLIPLLNGIPVNDLTGAIGSRRYYVVELPPQAKDLRISTSGGTGDADLYVRYGSIPTLEDWDYRPFRYGNNETVELAAPGAGAWYIMVYGWRAYAGVTLVAHYTLGDHGVYRFWSPTLKGHFYTISRSERDQILSTWPDVWGYEGVAWYAHPQAAAGASPVYRFWSPVYRKHFYTISQAERDHIQATWPDVWTYEGVAWHAYTAAGAGRSPIYRFWSPVNRAHFFTISQAERDHIIATWPDTWQYEGVAYYAFTSEAQVPTASGAEDRTAAAMTTADRADANAPVAGDARRADFMAGHVDVSDEVSSRYVPSTSADGMRMRSASDAVGTYYPLALDDRVVAAMVYDPSEDAWRHVLSATLAPAGIQLPAMPAGRRAWLAVMTRDAEAGDWTLAHGNWFGRLADEPTEPVLTVEDDELTGVELPVETLAVPDVTETVTVLVYCARAGAYIDAMEGLRGGATVEFPVPAWNRWYRLDFVEATDGTLIASQWIGHLRTHGPEPAPERQ